MNFPEELKYTKDHEWISLSDMKVGVTSFAVEQLGDIVHIELPEPGKEIAAGDSFGTIESTKTVSDLYMPVAGKVVAVNSEVLKAPESLQQDSYQQGWLIQLETSAQPEGLMNSAEYQAFIAEG